MIDIHRIIISANHDNENSPDEDVQHTDVIVELDDGSRYLATFYSLQQISERVNLPNHRQEIEAKYFWAPQLIVLDRCSRIQIHHVVLNMFDDGEFFDAFKRL